MSTHRTHIWIELLPVLCTDISNISQIKLLSMWCYSKVHHTCFELECTDWQHLCGAQIILLHFQHRSVSVFYIPHCKRFTTMKRSIALKYFKRVYSTYERIYFIDLKGMFSNNWRQLLHCYEFLFKNTVDFRLHLAKNELININDENLLRRK